MSMPEETNGAPKKKPREGIPLERILIVASIFGVVLLLFYGIRTLTEPVKFTSIPVAGAWQAQRKPWRIEFKPDNTIVSSTGPSQTDASQPGTSGRGKYKVDYFGTLWVTLDNGKVFKATLSTEMPNRFDLIEMDTEGVTVFDRVTQPEPNPPPASK
jgi:hypothetical protein